MPRAFGMGVSVGFTMADLRSVVQSHADAAWSAASDAAVPVAEWRRRMVERLGRCGDPYAGFVWLRCDACGVDRVVGTSCKASAVCPRCGGRRMASVAAHQVERVLPAVPLRQWVVTFPQPLPRLLAWRPAQ